MLEVMKSDLEMKVDKLEQMNQLKISLSDIEQPEKVHINACNYTLHARTVISEFLVTIVLCIL